MNSANPKPDLHLTDWKYGRRKFLSLSAIMATGLAAWPSFSCAGATPLRFGLMTDSHYADKDPLNTRYYRESLAKMQSCIKVMNSQQLDFIIHLGDFKDEGADKQEADTLRYLQELEAEFAQFKGPKYHCVGNHDVDSIRKAQFLQHIENTGIPKDRSYYSFDLKGIHFVVLDANFHKDGRAQFYAEGADWKDPNIPTIELEWFEKDLNQTSLPVLIFCHHPLYEVFHHDNQYHVNNHEAVRQIMESSRKVEAVFHGHTHEEAYTQINGIHYYTQSAMVDHSGLENNSFSIIELQQAGIQINGFYRVPDQYLKN